MVRLLFLLALLAAAAGLKLAAPLGRRSALSAALALAPAAAAFAADNSGTYGGSSGGYQTIPEQFPSSAPSAAVAPAATSADAGVTLSAGQRKMFEQAKAQKESIAGKMTPAEIAVLEKRILQSYPGMR